MFCDGQCKKKNKKCGLLIEMWLENKQNGEKRKAEICVFQAILESNLRSEGQLDGLHAAENSTRNEAAKGLREIKDVIGTGMIGMLKQAEERKKIERNYVRCGLNEPELIYERKDISANK